jgi:uncharacterized lipoprotein YddW (UPF0748 family)
MSQTWLAMKSFLAVIWRGWPAGFRAFFVAGLLSLNPSAGHAASGAPEASVARVYLWVVRGALEDTLRFASIADSAAAAGCTDLLVQVRGRGDAWYRSSIEPAPMALEARPPRGTSPGARPSEQCLRFDPLAAAIRAARARHLRVHAWMNVFLVGDPQRQGPFHVLRREPDWQAILKDGRPIDRLGEKEKGRLGVEGAYLSPGNQAVAEYLVSIAREIVARYEIDGLHLDYIRYPYADAGYDAASVAAFHADHPGAACEGEAWNTWRQERVSRVVAEISHAVRCERPGIEVSAAVLPDPFDARRSCMQDWPRWVQEEWIDVAMTMAYTATPDRFAFWMRIADAGTVDSLRVVPGIGLHRVNEASLSSMLARVGSHRGWSIALFSETELMREAGFRRVLRSWGGK